MRRWYKRKWVWVTLMVLGLGLGSWRYLLARNGKPKDVKLVAVKRMTLVSRVSETGVIQPITKVDVKSKVGGKIIQLPIEEGQDVRQGDLIAQLDVDELLPQVQQVEAQLRAAEARVEASKVSVDYQRVQTSASLSEGAASLETAEARRAQSQVELDMQRRVADAALREAISSRDAAAAQLAELKAGARPQEVEQAQQAVASAAARALEAERDLNRKVTLERKGYIPKAQVDAAQAAADVAQAELESARKRLSLTREGPRREEIDAAEAVMKQREAAVQTATANLNRVQVSQEALRQAIAGVAQAQATLASSRNGRRQEVIRRRELEQAVAEAARIRSQLRELRARLSYATVTAPVSGTVIRRTIEPGELITSGISAFNSGMTICTVADLRRMLVLAMINEVDVAKVRVGQAAEVHVDGVPNHTFRGRVVSVAPASTVAEGQQSGGSSVVKFAVKIQVENPERLLRPGMTATCSILTQSKRSVLALPLDALRERGPLGLVDVYQGEATGPRNGQPQFKEKTVRLGLKTATHAEVLGLAEGTRVRADKRKYVERKKIDVSSGPREHD